MIYKLKHEKPPGSIRKIILWWEKKRLIYFTILFVGTVSTVLRELKSLSEENLEHISYSDLIFQVIALLFFCNICYFAGYTLEIWLRHHYKIFFSTALRWGLFVIGTLLSIYYCLLFVLP